MIVVKFYDLILKENLLFFIKEHNIYLNERIRKSLSLMYVKDYLADTDIMINFDYNGK